MQDGFSEVKLFQVHPDKTGEFEALIRQVAAEQLLQAGCRDIRGIKRVFTIDGVEAGQPPRELARIVKCVKYYTYWEFDSKENYGKAIAWFFERYGKQIMKLLIMPFDISCGERIA